MSAGLAAILTGVAVLAFGATYRALRRISFRLYRIHGRFGLNPLRWKLLQTDLNNMLGGRIVKHGLIGRPDALFVSRWGKRRYIVGEYKHRNHRGRVRSAEEYQVTLYCGMIRAIKGAPATGVLGYKDGYRPIRFSRKTYSWLLSDAKPRLIAARVRGYA